MRSVKLYNEIVTVQPGLRTSCTDRAKTYRQQASGPCEATFMAGCRNRKPKDELLHEMVTV